MEIGLVIAILATLFISISVWVIISSTKKRILLALLIPFMVTIGSYSYVAVEAMLGYPVNLEIPEEALYVSHLVSTDKETIYLWSIDLSVEGGKPRAFKIKYTREDEEKLEKASENKANGIPQVIKKETKEVDTDGNKTDTTLNSMKIYDFDMSIVIKKGV